MADYPNFEYEVLQRLESLRTEVTELKVDVAKNYTPRREVYQAQKDATIARRWSIATAVPFVLMALDIYLIG